jgi:hypothetical protein
MKSPLPQKKLKALIEFCKNSDGSEGVLRKNPLGLKFLGCGASRAVFALDDEKCIKISRNDNNFGFQNKTEWEIWCKAQNHPEVKQHLCPILAHDEKNHQWTVMPIAQRVGGLSARDEDTIHHAIRRISPTSGDVESSNAGYIDGKPVALDYGYRTDYRG